MFFKRFTLKHEKVFLVFKKHSVGNGLIWPSVCDCAVNCLGNHYSCQCWLGLPHTLSKSCAVLSLSRSLSLWRSGQELCGFVHELRFTARRAKLNHSWMQWKQILAFFFSPFRSFHSFMFSGTPLPPHAWHITPLFFTAYALLHLHSLICSNDCTRLKETCPNLILLLLIYYSQCP